jgi:hypothetical protein
MVPLGAALVDGPDQGRADRTTVITGVTNGEIGAIPHPQAAAYVFTRLISAPGAGTEISDCSSRVWSDP